MLCPETSSPTVKRSKSRLVVRYEGREVSLSGRLAQTLALLIKVGANGFTSGDASQFGWARRTSAYVHQLRQLGFNIITKWEGVGDARVGRYILTVPVVVLRAVE